MSFGTLILILLLAAVFIVAAATAVFAILGAQRGCQGEWARRGLTISLGVVIAAAVVAGAVTAIRTLDRLSDTSSESAGNMATPSAVFDATGEGVSTTAAPVVTPPPGTVIRKTPEPERITGVNYGAGFELTGCNDYVYLLETATVYTGPGTEYESIGSLIAGATIKRIGYNDDWSLVDYNENYAFVANSALIVNE